MEWGDEYEYGNDNSNDVVGDQRAVGGRGGGRGQARQRDGKRRQQRRRRRRSASDGDFDVHFSSSSSGGTKARALSSSLRSAGGFAVGAEVRAGAASRVMGARHGKAMAEARGREEDSLQLTASEKDKREVAETQCLMCLSPPLGEEVCAFSPAACHTKGATRLSGSYSQRRARQQGKEDSERRREEDKDKCCEGKEKEEEEEEEKEDTRIVEKGKGGDQDGTPCFSSFGLDSAALVAPLPSVAAAAAAAAAATVSSMGEAGGAFSPTSETAAFAAVSFESPHSLSVPVYLLSCLPTACLSSLSCSCLSVDSLSATFAVHFACRHGFLFVAVLFLPY